MCVTVAIFGLNERRLGFSRLHFSSTNNPWRQAPPHRGVEAPAIVSFHNMSSPSQLSQGDWLEERDEAKAGALVAQAMLDPARLFPEGCSSCSRMVASPSQAAGMSEQERSSGSSAISTMAPGLFTDRQRGRIKIRNRRPGAPGSFPFGSLGGKRAALAAAREAAR